MNVHCREAMAARLVGCLVLLQLVLVLVSNVDAASSSSSSSTDLCKNCIEIGQKILHLPISLSYVGAMKCADSTCSTGGGFWTAAAIELAKQIINTDPKLEFFHNLNVVVYDPVAVQKRSLEVVAQAAGMNTSLAMFGYGQNCLDEATITAVNDRLGVSDQCTFDLGEYGNFPRPFIQMTPSPSTFGKGLIKILQKYKWKQVAVVSPSDGVQSSMLNTRDQLLNTLRASSVLVRLDARLPMSVSMNSRIDRYSAMVNELSTKARIIVVFDPTANCEILRYVLFGMAQNNLLDKGEYFIIGVISEEANRQWLDLTIPSLAMYFGMNALPSGFNITEAQVKSAYRSLLVISDAVPPSWTNDKWKKFQEQLDTVKLSSPQIKTPTNKFWSNTARIYDTMLLLASAGMDVINRGVDITSGLQYYEYMISRPFTSITGTPEYIDGDGLLVGTLQVHLFSDNAQRGGYSLWPVGRFGYENENAEDWGLWMYDKNDLKIDWITGSPPVDAPKCGFDSELCLSPRDRLVLILVCAGIALISVGVVVAIVIIKKWRYEKKLHNLDFVLDRRDILLKRYVNLLSMRSVASGMGSMGASVVQSRDLRKSHYLLQDYDENDKLKLGGGNGETKQKSGGLTRTTDDDARWNELPDFGVGLFEGNSVALKRLWKKDVDFTRTIRKEVLSVIESKHDNLNVIKGMVVNFPNVFIVSELCVRGSLNDILDNDEFALDPLFLASMARDICLGMDFLHSSRIGYHGRLRSSNCLIDSRWVVRLSSFGMRNIRSDETHDDHEEGVQQGRDLLWSAPELLRIDCNLALCGETIIQKADVFSFAILLYEIFGRSGPWGVDALEPMEIVERVKNPNQDKAPFRPDLRGIKEAPRAIQETIAAAWAEEPQHRPSFAQIKRRLRTLNTGVKKSIMENMVSMVEKYTDKLELDIAERTAELDEEKKKSENLLKMMLPATVAESLKSGAHVQAEAYKSVTVYFSDCVGFSAMSTRSTPTQVVQFLNDLYTCFDRIIGTYDVYKVVSGLPIPNGSHHVGEIASMSLALMDAIMKFKIRHLPGEQVQLRIGMHSGACVAGVVGLKMPRYCLFGDTVNTASRMESNGLPLKINCSQSARDLLREIGGYEVAERGLVHMKGKGDQMTYFVLSEDKDLRRERILREKVKFPTLRNTVTE